jgi:hypothetical protein
MFSKKEFTLESMDLNEATREVISLSLNDLQRNRVALQLELADPLPLVMGDRVQLQQVILNLIRNASEAMADVDDRPRRMVVRTEADSEEGVRVIVGTPASASTIRISTSCSTRSTRQNTAAWASDCPSVVRSSSDIMAACGPNRTKAQAQRSPSPCLARDR